MFIPVAPILYTVTFIVDSILCLKKKIISLSILIYDEMYLLVAVPPIQPPSVIVVRKSRARHRHQRSHSRDVVITTRLNNVTQQQQQQPTIVELSDSSLSIDQYSEISQKSRVGEQASYLSLDQVSVAETSSRPPDLYDELTLTVNS